MSMSLKHMGAIFLSCFCLLSGLPSLAASLEDMLPQAPMEERQAPARKEAPDARLSRQAQAKRSFDWSGTYNSENTSDYAEGYVTVKAGGSAYQVALGFSFGRGLNRSMYTLDNGTGREEKGQLYIYNSHNRHVFTLARQGKFLKLLVARGMTERDLFNKAESMSPGDDEPLIEPAALDGREKDRWLDLETIFKRWEKSDF